jgi:hypothetical protein
MSKIAEPYRCDGPGCAKQRSSDANHWWLVRLARAGNTGPLFVEVSAWNPNDADIAGMRHACGIDCMTKIVAGIAGQMVDAESAGKGAANGA